jgi:hypothetical protein
MEGTLFFKKSHLQNFIAQKNENCPQNQNKKAGQLHIFCTADKTGK